MDKSIKQLNVWCSEDTQQKKEVQIIFLEFTQSVCKHFQVCFLLDYLQMIYDHVPDYDITLTKT